MSSWCPSFSERLFDLGLRVLEALFPTPCQACGCCVYGLNFYASGSISCSLSVEGVRGCYVWFAVLRAVGCPGSVLDLVWLVSLQGKSLKLQILTATPSTFGDTRRSIPNLPISFTCRYMPLVSVISSLVVLVSARVIARSLFGL